ncbi:MAG: LLM class flavin-dependent oxidoreductase [Gemmatimonadaceae bacterium]
MTQQIELGLETFGVVARDGGGHLLSHAEIIRHAIDEAVLAEERGVFFFGIGEHHREDFAVSSPGTDLATIADRTWRIRLGSAVTGLSSDDPARVFQRSSTLGATFHGRADSILGRGSCTESFALFDFPLEQYSTRFEERLELFAAIRESGRTGTPVTWRGTTRAPLSGKRVYPSTASGTITTWIGMGGSPDSVLCAARDRTPLMLAIIGGAPQRFSPYVELYKRALADLDAPALGRSRMDIKYSARALSHEALI